MQQGDHRLDPESTLLSLAAVHPRTCHLTALWLCTLKRKVMADTGFLCGSAGKESTCSAGSTPGLGRSPSKGKGYLLQYSGLENSQKRNMTERLRKSRCHFLDTIFTLSDVILTDPLRSLLFLASKIPLPSRSVVQLSLGEQLPLSGSNVIFRGGAARVVSQRKPRLFV